VEYVADKKNVASRLHEIVRPNDIVIALGAGDINQSARDLVARLGGHGGST
jgi:UDP-N-acetylmuramate--alanine ligase